MNNKSVIGFIAFVFVVMGLIFLGVIDKDPYQEEREIVAKAENLRHKIIAAIEERIDLIDEVAYRIRLLDEFFGESDSFQVLENCERERKASEELLLKLEEMKNFAGQEFNIKKLEKSNAELAEILNELRSFSEDENDLKEGRKVTI